MRYIILGAGKGTRLHPLTLNCPKCLFNVDVDYSIAQRMVNLIHTHDETAEVIYVVGFMSEVIQSSIYNVKFVHNPFYDITNSIASLWFAKEYLNDDVCIINGDIVAESKMVKEVVTNDFKESYVVIDPSVKTDGDYNVNVKGDEVIVMSKDLKDYYAEYVGITKLKKEDVMSLKYEIEDMINNGHSDQWYENALVQLIFNKNFTLKVKEVADYNWTEVDCVDDLIKAKHIHLHDNKWGCV